MFQATKRSVWFQTAAGEMVELEYELGWQSPLICEKLKCGVGAKESSPIYLDENVNTKTLELIFGYFRFHQATGHSDKVGCMFACLLLLVCAYFDLKELDLIIIMRNLFYFCAN